MKRKKTQSQKKVAKKGVKNHKNKPNVNRDIEKKTNSNTRASHSLSFLLSFHL